MAIVEALAAFVRMSVNSLFRPSSAPPIIPSWRAGATRPVWIAALRAADRIF
jgi:hypothetical protein